MIQSEVNPVEPTRRVFPTPGTSLARLLYESEFRNRFHERLKTVNPIVVAVYRAGLLPLFGAARSIMLLSTRGRKSGKMRRAPVGYFRIGGALHVFSTWGKASGWYKNILAAPGDVVAQVGMRKFPVRAQVLQDPAEIQRTLEQFVRESPVEAQTLFGWDAARDRIEDADFSAIIEKVLIVRFIEK
jgi:deazaflavin-dependent oxidoreductase (nitroreductase family)